VTATEALRRHWPEYLIEAWGLGTFMLSAALFTTLFEFPGSPLRDAIPSDDGRRTLIGIAMGLTAIGIIYSRWGQRSGAHLNPSVTLAFLRLGRITPWDAALFIASQFIGGWLGVLAAHALLGAAFAEPPVQYVVTVPGPWGAPAAFASELAISFGLMCMVLWVSSTTRVAHFTGLLAGALVALYIGVEGPVSGMSMNPARTLSSALPSGIFDHLWIYFVAPPLGMQIAAELFRRLTRKGGCAKLDHPADVPCIHCGQKAKQSAVVTHTPAELAS
jgi:aquaporin Z